MVVAKITRSTVRLATTTTHRAIGRAGELSLKGDDGWDGMRGGLLKTPTAAGHHCRARPYRQWFRTGKSGPAATSRMAGRKRVWVTAKADFNCVHWSRR